MKQLLALEAVAICLHGTLVGNVATRKESSDIDTQASKELGVKHAVQIVLNVFQAIGIHIARHVGADNLYLFARDIVGEGLLPQIDQFVFCVSSHAVPGKLKFCHWRFEAIDPLDDRFGPPANHSFKLPFHSRYRV